MPFVNVFKTLTKEFDNSDAVEARAKDDIDTLIEAIKRTVPNFETEYRPRVLEEFKRLKAAKSQPAAQT